MVSPQEGGRLIFCRKLLLFLFGGIGVRESPFWDWGHPGRWDPNSQHGGWAGWSLLPQPQAALVKWAGCRHFLQAGPARARPRHSGLQERCTPPPGADPRTYKLCGEKQDGNRAPCPSPGKSAFPVDFAELQTLPRQGVLGWLPLCPQSQNAGSAGAGGETRRGRGGQDGALRPQGSPWEPLGFSSSCENQQKATCPLYVSPIPSHL